MANNNDYVSEYSGARIDELLNKVDENNANGPDTTPTTGSQHLITSGGVKAALNEKADSSDLSELAETVGGVDERLDEVEGKIPSAASNSNQLADKAFVNNGLDGKASQGSVNAINAKIPNAASAENQLADKQFVNTGLGQKASATDVEAIQNKIPSNASPSNKMATQSDIANFITKSVNDLTNYYLKSETYTKSEVQALIGAINQFHYEIYESTSAVTDPQSNVLYLIGPTGSGSDKYEEYVYANSTFVKIGDTSIDLSGYVTTTALNTALAGYTTTADLTTLLDAKANKSNVDFIETSFGKYDAIREITLSQGKSGKYVSVSGSEVSASGYGISNSIELNFGDILLVPSASAVPADVSVVARIVTRTYQKVINYTYTYQQANPELYNTATADYDSSLVYTAVYDTSGETPVLTGWTKGGQAYETLPATHEVTESYYEPLVKQAVSAMPSTGYYVYLCPSAMTVVISGYTATVSGGVCKVVGWGIFKNIVSNFVGAPGQSILAQLLCDLDARTKGIMARLENLGEVRAITIDSENLPMVCGQPLVIEGAGAPSVVPQFVGQRYHDKTSKKCYEAFNVTASTGDWTLLN